MDTVTSSPSFKSIGSRGVSFPLENLALIFLVILNTLLCARRVDLKLKNDWLTADYHRNLTLPTIAEFYLR